MSNDKRRTDPTPAILASKIKLYSGEYFDYSKPDETPITMVDIAVGLSNVCRFGGQLESFYSVAEHSVLCLNIARHLGCTLEEKIAVLLHDAAECVMGDMPGPLKMLLPQYKAIENRVYSEIQKTFNIGYANSIVKPIDLMALRVEKETLKGGQDRWHLLEDVRDMSDIVQVSCLSPYGACSAFLDAAIALNLIDGSEVEKQKIRNLHASTVATMAMLANVVAKSKNQEAANDLGKLTSNFGNQFGPEVCEALLQKALTRVGYTKSRDGELTVFKKGFALFSFSPNPELN